MGADRRGRPKGPEECANGSRSVQAALHLAGARPAAGPGVLARLEPPGARPATDRAVAVEQQRGDQDAVLGDVAVDVVLRPGSDRVELYHAALLVPLDDLHVLARLGLVAAQARGPGDVVLQRGPQRHDLAQCAALVGVALVEAGAEGRVLLLDALPGSDRADVHRQRPRDGVPRADGLGEGVAGAGERGGA